MLLIEGLGERLQPSIDTSHIEERENSSDDPGVVLGRHRRKRFPLSQIVVAASPFGKETSVEEACARGRQFRSPPDRRG